MKLLKKACFLLLMLAAAQTVCAAEDESFYLHIKTAAGWRVLDLNKVDRLSFSGNTMTASDANNNVVETFNRSEIDVMSVNDDPENASTGIVDVKADAGVAFTFDSATASVKMLKNGPLKVYDVNGALLVSIPAVAGGEAVDLSAIESGIVIINSNNYNLKAALK